MAKQTTEQVKRNLETALGSEEQKEPEQYLFSGVTQEQLDEWKEKYKEVHIVTVVLRDGEAITGYFSKPVRDVMANCINLYQDKKVFEAREFLLKNTFIGGDRRIITNTDASMVAQTRLWTLINFLTAEGKTY